MYHYDILRDTWIYQEIKEQVQAEEHAQQQTELRRILLEIIQARFPRTEAQAKYIVENITNREEMGRLLVKIGAARREREVRQDLHDAGKKLAEADTASPVRGIIGYDHNTDNTS